MNPRTPLRWLWLCLLSLPLCAEPLALLDFAQEGVLDQISVNGNSGVTYQVVDGPQGKALQVTITPSDNGYPGIALKPGTGVWDLSQYGTVEAVITNLSGTKLRPTLRVDNPGNWQDNPWNANHGDCDAGATLTLTTYFGYSWGKQGFALDPSKVNQLLVFIGKVKEETKFRVDAVRADGQPGAKPPGIVEPVFPAGGDLLVGLTADRLEAKGAQAELAGNTVKLTFEAKQGAPSVALKCPAGSIWNLGWYNQVEFTLRNPGDAPVKVTCRVDNAWANDQRNCALASADLPAGATQTVVVPFGGKVWDGNDKASGNQLRSDTVVGLNIHGDRADTDQIVELLGAKASVSQPPTMPDWLGQRPPVPGDWKLTFEDTFDGPAIDETKWSLPPKPERSIWDRNSLNLADHSYVEDGCLKLKVSKLQGFQTDDERLKDKTYANGFVRSLDKFAQLYGYFEARLKLPDVQGMWPAFWMMPDRGVGTKDRRSTADGGMEFDIYEQLARFGPFRTNIAFHWDGYGKDHKSFGTDRIYYQCDAEGYVTAGLLWEPGRLTWYYNGQQVAVYENERVASVPGFLKLTMPTGGWGDCPVDESKLPATFDIDWVRVWQRP